MNDDDATLWGIALTFAVISFFTIGGANTALPEMHRQMVDLNGWMTSQRFADLFAVAQAAPGPNVIVVTLLGWEVARLPGAAAATLAMLLPTSVLTYFFSKVWHRYRFARWRIALQQAVVPITIGLLAAAAFVLSRAADKSIAAALVTLATAAAVYFTRIHPLLFLLAGAALGMAGLL